MFGKAVFVETYCVPMGTIEIDWDKKVWEGDTIINFVQNGRTFLESLSKLTCFWNMKDMVLSVGLEKMGFSYLEDYNILVPRGGLKDDANKSKFSKIN